MRSTFTRISRRTFLSATGGTVASFLVAPRHAIAGSQSTPPSEKLNIAFIGVGGRGGANLNGLGNQNVVALCDVDSERAAKAFQSHPKARRFQDFRKMFDAMDKSIDAVAVSTPDHTHAVAALAAIRRGKHVYCEKPLAHSIAEVRALMRAAREHRVITQLGNQGHSSDTIRNCCEWIWAGAVGRVHTVHAVSGAMHCRIDDLPRLGEPNTIPPGLDWDLWLGPVPARPYHPVYLPGKWRAWSAFGSGAIGDWVCHVVDPSFWALDLGAPTSIQAEAKNYDPKKHGETFPPGTIVTYQFPAKGKRGPIQLVWFDGSAKLPRPADLEPDDKMPTTGAALFGDKGTLIHGSHGAGGVRLIPQAKMDAFQRPEKTLARVRSHHQDFLQAVRTGKPAGSNFEYGGPLTEIALLGIIATKRLGEKLEWDSVQMRFTNSPPANELLRPTFRTGWEI